MSTYRTMPTVTAGPNVGNPDRYGCSITRWTPDGTASNRHVYAGPSREMAQDIAADVRGALADAYHTGRADVDRVNAARLADLAAELIAEMENGTATGRQYRTLERIAERLAIELPPIPPRQPVERPEVPADWPVQPVELDNLAPHERARLTSCGECGRAWDDTQSTSLTPAPGARCPFEPFH